MSFFKGLMKRPVTVLMVTIMMLVFGGISTINMEQSLLPDISMPNIIVMTTYSGAGPEEVEKLVTEPIEQAVSTVPNFVNVTSTSSYGSSMVMVEVSSEADMNFTALKVREQISMIDALLPDGASDPIIMELDTNQMPALAITMTSPTGFTEFSNLAENTLLDRLESVSGVASVTATGVYDNQLQINVRKEKLDQYGISFTQLAGLIQMESATLPGGQVVEGHNTFTIKTKADIKTLQEVENLVVQTVYGNVKLSELADISIAPKDTESSVSVNGDGAISFYMYKQPNYSTTEVCEALIDELDQICEDYNGMRYIVILDQAESIKDSINSLLESGLWGALFAVLVLFVFLRSIRSTIVIGCAIPISIIVTFVFMYFNKMSINTMSLSGLVLGVGMLVDNSVVVLESIYGYLEKGYSKTEAAVLGTKTVAMAVVASTLTSVAVYIPLFFMSDNIAITMFKEVAMTIMFALGASLLVALTLVPVLCSKILKVNTKALERAKKDSFLMKGYKKVLNFAFRRKGLVIIIGVGAFVVSIMGTGMLGMEMFPATDSGSVQISLELPKGTELAETKQVGNEILTVALDRITPLVTVTDCMESYGSAGMSFMSSSDSSTGTITLLLEDRKKRDYSSEDIAEELRNALQDFAGVDIKVSASDMTSLLMGTGSNVGINIKGQEFEELERLANECKTYLMSLDGVRDVTTTLDEVSYEYNVIIDRDKTALYGISARSIAQTVQTAFLGSQAGSVRIDGNEYDVVVRYDDQYRNTKDDLGNIMIASPTGMQIPLSELATIEKESVPLSIERNAKERIVTVSATAYGKTPGEINDKIEEFLKGVPVENGYSITTGDSAKEMEESFSLLFLMLGVSVLLVYMVMAAQFESLLHPFAVMFAIPLSMIGIVIALMIAGMPLSIPALIGIIALSGVVVNNAIVLIDYANQLRREGISLLDALKTSCVARIRPILITTITTILGLFPMAVSQGEGAELMQPLAVSFIGGLTISTVLTLVFVPCVYMILENIKAKLFKKFKKDDSASEEESATVAVSE